jgi:acyl carrier protein
MNHRHTIKQYIIDEYVPDASQTSITDDMDLLENGIVDSLAVLKLVAFIEDNFDVTLQPEEIDPDNLKSVNAINDLICSKL